MKKLRILVTGVVLGMALMMFGRTDAYAEVQEARNLKQFRKIVYREMISRNDCIEIDYSGDDYKEIFESFEKEAFIDELASIDDVSTSDDHDYMIQNVSYMKTSMKGTDSDAVRFTIDIKWRETLGQLQYVNLKVDDILKILKIDTIDSVHDRIKIIHDYIVSNVEYDTSLKYENAYCALKEGISTCQGYSLLFYKMVTEAGIPCRYITGTGINDKENGPHGWNIVKIGDLWYNIDTTWDDPIYTDPSAKVDEVCYDYFLKGSQNYDPSHIRDAEFLTAEFLSKYVVSVKDFDKLNDVSITQMSLGANSELTEETLKEDDEEEVDESDADVVGSILEDLKKSLDRMIVEIQNGNFKDYVIKSYRELDDRSRMIIIALIAIILISILYKIFRSTHKKDDFDTMFDSSSSDSSKVGGIEEMIARDEAEKKAARKAKKKAEKEAKKAKLKSASDGKSKNAKSKDSLDDKSKKGDSDRDLSSILEGDCDVPIEKVGKSLSEIDPVRASKSAEQFARNEGLDRRNGLDRRVLEEPNGRRQELDRRVLEEKREDERRSEEERRQLESRRAGLDRRALEELDSVNQEISTITDDTPISSVYSAKTITMNDFDIEEE